VTYPYKGTIRLIPFPGDTQARLSITKPSLGDGTTALAVTPFDERRIMMPTNTDKLPKRLPSALCEGAWFCYVLCLFVPMGMMLALLLIALLSIL
jgi:hypothetical protein